jgi:hypothetical protein
MDKKDFSIDDFTNLISYAVLKKLDSNVMEIPIKTRLQARKAEIKFNGDEKTLDRLITKFNNVDDFKKIVKYNYKSIKTLNKYISKNFKKSYNIESKQEEQKTFEFINKFKSFLLEKEKCHTCFYYDDEENEFNWLSNDMVRNVVKTCEKSVMNKVDEKDNLSVKLDKYVWYCMVVNDNSRSYNEYDEVSRLLFNVKLKGIVFWFTKEKNRDIVFKYLKSKIK